MKLYVKQIVVIGYGVSGAGAIASLLLFAIWTHIASNEIKKAINKAAPVVATSVDVNKSTVKKLLNTSHVSQKLMSASSHREMNLDDIDIPSILDGVVQLTEFDKQIAIGAIWSLAISLVFCLATTIYLCAKIQ